MTPGASHEAREARDAGEAGRAVETSVHPASIAVWGVPSPIVVNTSFTARVGMKCASACALTGERIEVCDEAGAALAHGSLGETPWPGTEALYLAEVTLPAPSAEGVHRWSAAFRSPASAPHLTPHGETSTPFTFRTVRPPEHRLTVTVTDGETREPFANVQVRLGVYRTATDEGGQARLDVAGGEYALDVRKVGYETISRTVEVRGDIEIPVEVSAVPDIDPDDERVWM